MVILRMQDSKWIKGFPTYFIILQNINKLYFDLMNCSIDDFEKAEEIIYFLSVQISRIVPLKGKKGTKEKALKYSDGILQLKDDVNFLKNDYDMLYNNCKKTILDLSDIRNKYEHEPHNIIAIRYISGNKEQIMDFLYKKYDAIFLLEYPQSIQEQIKNGEIKLEWRINSTEIGNFLIRLNKIFKKIQLKYLDAPKNYKGLDEYAIYKKIINIDIEKFNKDIAFYIE